MDRVSDQCDRLDRAIHQAAAGVPVWATVIRVDPSPDTGPPRFETIHYRDSATAIDFWPASVVKLYTCVAAFVWCNQLGIPDDAVFRFQRPAEPDGPNPDGGWLTDCTRTLPEMCSNIFRESANEDYTLLLRLLGPDWLNERFLTPANGFARTALQRGYIHDPPHRFTPQEAQRIEIYALGDRPRRLHTREHTWSGVSHAARLGQTLIDRAINNCSSTGDMAECMRRLMFHESLPPAERFDLTPAQLELLREGRDGFTGLRNTRWTWAWADAIAEVLPDARFYHKSGNISTHYLDLVYVSDEASDTHFIGAVATASGSDAACRRIFRAIARTLLRR